MTKIQGISLGSSLILAALIIGIVYYKPFIKSIN